MPDPVTHLTASSTLASGGIITTIGLALGVDPAALVCAFLGALVWRGIQPKIVPNFDEIYRAFSWAVVSMVLGTLGGMAAETAIHHYYEIFKQAPHVSTVGLPAFIVSFVANPMTIWAMKRFSEWRPK